MQYFSGGKYPIPQTMIVVLCEVIKLLGTIIRSKCKFDFLMYLFVKYVVYTYTSQKNLLIRWLILKIRVIFFGWFVRDRYREIDFRIFKKHTV